MNFRSRLGLAIVALLSATTVGAQTQETQGLAPGDQIRITVWRKPEMSCDCVVAGNGSIVHPLYRDVQVVGVPLSTVEDRLRTFLARYEQNPQFVIQPLVRIVVGGEVRTPNIYAVPPETTIAQAIALAGGLTERGSLRSVRIVRQSDRSRKPIKVKVNELLQPGDTIVCSERLF